MWFVTLVKFRHRPTKADFDKATAYFGEMMKQGTKFHETLWTLGRYDAVLVLEASDVNTAMKDLLNVPVEVATETLVAVSREEAGKMLMM